MKTVPLAPYEDNEGNRIEYTGPPSEGVRITFRGSNNTARIHPDAHVRSLEVDFNASNGTFELGANPKRRGFSAQVRVGEDATVRVRDGVSATSKVVISAVEGVTVDIGEDTMFASQNQVRADDGHPIFDVHTGERINIAWERPHLGLTAPFYKPHASTVKKSKYWRRTDPDFSAGRLVDATTPRTPTSRQRPASTARRSVRRVRRLAGRLRSAWAGRAG